MKVSIKSAIIGYGGKYNMGKIHGEEMGKAGIELIAVCDMDSSRVEQAQKDFPGISAFTSVEELLKDPHIDLVTVITPHNMHAPLARQILESGKHCILEKPMSIRADHANELVQLAKEKQLMLSVYHNRRWNDWYLTLQDLIQKDLLGELFYAELFFGGFGHPGYMWRSNKEISGGALYDWGAHYLDWLLGVMPGKVKSVRGYKQNRLWHDVTNDDHVDGIIQFESGAVVHLQSSSIAYAGKTERRFLGTKGAVTSSSKDPFLTLYTQLNELKVETRVQHLPAKPLAYYQNIADHLLEGAELIIKPEQASRVIAILESIGKSADLGCEIEVPYE